MAEYKSIYTGEEIDSALGKANTALQQETDPIFSASPSASITNQDITNWNGKSDFSGSYNDLTNKPELFSGDYDDLSNKPDIPSATSDLTNDSGFITNATDGLTNYYKKSESYNKDEVDAKISSVYKYKGTVSTYGDLPDTNLTVGDVYNVETADSTHGIKAGDNVAWNGTVWDVLAGTIDLSGYQELIDSSHKLDASLVDDSLSTNKFVTSAEKTVWNGKQDELTAGENIEIINNVISASGGEIPSDLKVFYIKAVGGTTTFDFSEHETGLYFFENKEPRSTINISLILNSSSQTVTLYPHQFLCYFKDVNEISTNNVNFAYIYLLGVSGRRVTTGYQMCYSTLNGAGFAISENVSRADYIDVSSVQTISEKKTFSVLPESSVTPTTNNQLTNKSYVDDAISNAVGSINIVLATLTTPSGNGGE